MARLRAQTKIIAPLLCAVAALPSEGAANVNLEWRVPSQTVRVGDTVEAGLYAVSDDETDQPFMALDVIVGWDATVLELTGSINDGYPSWAGSGFLNDCSLDGLNAECPTGESCFWSGDIPCNDGDALFQAFVLIPDLDLQATPEGLLVTTFLFTAVAPAPATDLVVVTSSGDFSVTRVLNGPAENVTGTFGSVTLLIAACGTRGDFDGNCRVDIDDVDEFVGCLSGPGGGPVAPGCEAALFDDDDDADLHDIAAFQREFIGPPE